MYRYRHARPKVSFALATAMVIVIALMLSGILHISIDMTPIQDNPQAVALAIVLSIIAGLLLYEW